MRGLLLTLVALVVGVAVLASVGRTVPSRNAAATAPPVTTTTVPPTTTTTLATHAPTSVKVLVANGTSTAGLAGRFSSLLEAKGYDTLAPTDTTGAASASAVYYLTGYEGDAEAVATLIGLTLGDVQTLSSAVPVPSSTADVVVVVGPDLVGSPLVATTTTTTTATTTTAPG